jgi:acyl transferase domain-containing protein
MGSSPAPHLTTVSECRPLCDACVCGRSYGRGEAFAAAVVAPVRDGVEALVLLWGSGVNQDGRASSLTAPNGPSQTALLAEVLRGAGAASRAVNYVALHGTGTPLGDPIEVCLSVSYTAPHGTGTPLGDPIEVCLSVGYTAPHGTGTPLGDPIGACLPVSYLAPHGTGTPSSDPIEQSLSCQDAAVHAVPWQRPGKPSVGKPSEGCFVAAGWAWPDPKLDFSRLHVYG